jgi:hypothetical protein
MPTTIDSAGITFNDTTSLTSANIGTAQLVNGSVIASKLGTTEQTRIAKAWVNFNGTTSPGTIRSSYNVSSVTKNGTGDYTVNFTTPMADANYSANVTGATPTASIGLVNITRGNPTTSLIYVASSSSGGLADTTFVGVAIFGN